MPKYIVRVELHDAKDGETYTILHSLMEKAGFKRKIQDLTTLLWYHLPTAEYLIETPLTTKAVNKLAFDTASKTNKELMVLTVFYHAVIWKNLRAVK